MKWFNELTSNEQKLLKYGLSLVLIAIAWVFIYQPLNKTVKAKLTQKQSLQKQLSEMKASEGLFKTQQIKNNQNQRDINQPFNVWIDSQLLSNKLSQYLSRSEPKDNNTLILTFDSVVFDDLIAWLQPLEQNFNIVISEADIALTDKNNGLCNARITLVEN